MAEDLHRMVGLSLMDQVRSLAILEGFSVEYLHVHIDSSQLRSGIELKGFGLKPKQRYKILYWCYLSSF